MSGGILLAGLPLWQRRSDMFLSILREALELLPDKETASDELALNRELFRCIEEAYQIRAKHYMKVPDFYPVSDAPNPPLEPEKTTAERKKPDLRWELVDHQAGKGVAFRPFAVECKRIRANTKSTNFNREYVIEGIARFISSDHRYGEHSDRGAMVGYWQGMRHKDIIAEINKHLSAAGLPNIGVGSGKLLESDQSLEREFPVSPYRLTHLLVDVRHSVSRRVSTPAKRGTSKKSPSTVETLAGLIEGEDASHPTEDVS